MPTTCADIVSRAVAFSSANASLASDSSVMLSRIRADQSALFSKAAEVNRDFFATAATLASSVGTSGRTIALANVSPPVERLLTLVLQDGREVAQVDPLFPDGEFAPRYTTQGLTLCEVGSDWGSPGQARTATVTYVAAPTDIDPAGALTQTVSLPDRWTDLLVVALALYLAHADVGREPDEIARLQSLYDSRLTDFTNYLTHLGGVQARTLLQPTPGGATR